MFAVQGLERFIHLSDCALINALDQCLIDGEERYFAFGFANFSGHFFLSGNEKLDRFMAEEQGGNHRFFIHFIGTAFHH